MPTATGNGVELEYEVFGAGGAETFLLINGLGSQMTRWPADFCGRLADAGFQVVRFDNRDVGKSTWLTDDQPYTVEDMAADAMAVLDAVGVARAHIVGMSMGGMIAQTVASDFPERTLSLTSIMSATGNPDLPPATPKAWAVISQPAPDPKDREAYLAHAVENAETIGSPAYPWPEGALRERAEQELARAFNPAGVARQMGAIRASGDRRAKVRTITAPTVVLHGAEDPLVPPEGGRDTAALIAGAELREIPGMGHDLPPALYETFLQAMLRAAQRAHATA